MTDPTNQPGSGAGAASESAPEADRLEQLTPLAEDDEDFQPPAQAPYEADEADALEQSMAVPMDDDYPQNG